jgi:PKD repeat protein
MKHLKLVALLALIIGCSPQERLEVKAINILPPGGDVDSITAYVDLQGSGIVRLDWERRAYGIDSLVKTEYWYIDSSDVYTSTLSVTDGWYWLSIYDEDSALLATSDSVFCGTDTNPPLPIADFTTQGNLTSGPVPLRVWFCDRSINNTRNEWDLGDGHQASHSPGGAFLHIYETVGIYTVTLIASNEYGADTLIREDYIHVTEP